MPDLDFSGPWGTTDENATPFFQDQVRQAWGGWSADGFCDDGAAGYLAAVTATGADTTINVHFFNGVVRGIHVEQASTDLDVEGFGGTTPTSGQTRIDRVIIRLDFAARTAELLVLCGTPASSGAVAPTLTQQDDIDGIWEHELAQIQRVGNVAVTQAMISLTGQRFIAPTVYATTNAVVQGVKTQVGTITFTDTDITAYRRTIAADHTSLQHKSILDPDWTAATLATATWELGAGSRAFQLRMVGGVLQITGDARLKSSTARITDAWMTVATFPASLVPELAARVPATAPQVYGHVSAHVPSGWPLSWQLGVPRTGTVVLQVCSKFSTGMTAANLPLFEIPVGA